MTFYKSAIADHFQMDLRTLNRRLEAAGVPRILPIVYKRKAVFTEDHLHLIEQKIGTPQNITRYMKYSEV